MASENTLIALASTAFGLIVTFPIYLYAEWFERKCKRKYHHYEVVS